jgi:hypothetical protein
MTNHPAVVEVEGQVRGNNRAFGPDARYIVDDINAIKLLDVRDLSQTNIQLIQHFKEDSDSANSIDKNMVGESQGARTSAYEASNIASNSQRPNLVNIEYIMEQWMGFVAQRYQVLWEAYGRHDQIVQITDEDDVRVKIKPTNLGGEYDIVIDIVDDIKESEVRAQRIISYAQTVGSIPQLAQTVDWNLLSEQFAESVFGSSKFVIGSDDGDAVATAQVNVNRMLNLGLPLDGITQDMNLKKHLEIYKEERKRWVGSEEQNPNVALLDQAIEELEEAIESQASGGQSMTPRGATTEGDLTAGAMGGIQ